MRRPQWIKNTVIGRKTSERRTQLATLTDTDASCCPISFASVGSVKIAAWTKQPQMWWSFTPQYIICHKSKGHLAPLMGSPLGCSQLGSLLGSGWSHPDLQLRWLGSSPHSPSPGGWPGLFSWQWQRSRKEQRACKATWAKDSKQTHHPFCFPKGSPTVSPEQKVWKQTDSASEMEALQSPCWHSLQGWVKKNGHICTSV